MKFTVRYVSDWHENKTHEVELETLEEFIGWCDDQGDPVIVSGTDLKIYDDYME